MLLGGLRWWSAVRICVGLWWQASCLQTWSHCLLSWLCITNHWTPVHLHWFFFCVPVLDVKTAHAQAHSGALFSVAIGLAARSQSCSTCLRTCHLERQVRQLQTGPSRGATPSSFYMLQISPLAHVASRDEAKAEKPDTLPGRRWQNFETLWQILYFRRTDTDWYYDNACWTFNSLPSDCSCRGEEEEKEEEEMEVEATLLSIINMLLCHKSEKW